MRMLKKSLSRVLPLSFTLLLFVFVSCDNTNTIKITHGDLVFEINQVMHTKVSSIKEGAKPFMASYQPSELIKVKGGAVEDFKVQDIQEADISEPLKGHQWTITGLYKMGEKEIEKVLVITVYEAHPDLLSMKYSLTNKSDEEFYIEEMRSHSYELLNQNDDPGFWAFQGSSTEARADWIQPIRTGYYNRNYLGMNNSDYGGGIPVTSAWRKDAGLAIGHLELNPKLVSLPTEMPLGKSNIEISVSKFYDYPTRFTAGETLESLETFVMVHSGDYYNALNNYSKLMQNKGIVIPEPEEAAFEPIWCAWGYERQFTAEEVIGTLPKVKELGIKWAVLDDGFQIAEGDWDANPKKYPRGNVEIRELVDNIHSYGLKAKIWWTPLAADPGSNALKENPDMRLFTEDWSPQFITWWDAYYLAPVNDKTVAHTKEILDLFLTEWDFDGLKMDGQHMNGVQPDHNPASNLEYPEQAVEGLPDFFHMIYDYTRNIKPNAVIENCPCGTCMSFFNMPAMNQAVSSDPLSSWQIRHKGKTYKALIPNTAYYGDHVELSDDASDFASSFGVGGVLGTKFTWPEDNPNASESFLLTPEKEIVWKKWFSLYNDMMLSKEEYIGGLYDIGYDIPEGHAIKKDNSVFYAFYADNFEGSIELRGLADGTYKIRDYYNNIDLGTVSTDSPVISTSFKDFLLLEVSPN